MLTLIEGCVHGVRTVQVGCKGTDRVCAWDVHPERGLYARCVCMGCAP